MTNNTEIELIDSGLGEKLERFGDKYLIRPASSAIWRKQSETSLWDKADAFFTPQIGWQFKGKKFESWQVEIDKIKMLLRLQTNGQVGLFPEHISYMKTISDFAASKKEINRPLKVLNLFAYTGLATLYCLNLGAEVWHIDLTKKVLDWARENIAINNFKEPKAHLIAEDAVAYIQREVRRNKSYDIIIADPPSFSRISKNKSASVDELLLKVIECVPSILGNESLFILTSHAISMDRYTIANLVRDSLQEKVASLEHRDLTLENNSSDRKLGAGYLAIAKTK